MPDLVFDSVTDTTSVLLSFSNILLIGCALLVPIVVTLPDLPLTLAHLLHARAKLSFASSVADEPDLPANVRALLRSSETAFSAVAKFHLQFIGSLLQSSGYALHVFRHHWLHSAAESFHQCMPCGNRANSQT